MLAKGCIFPQLVDRHRNRGRVVRLNEDRIGTRDFAQ